MIVTRRRFSIGTMAASLTTACGRRNDSAPSVAPSQPHPQPTAGGQRLLILGGTGFLGPHVVDAAQAAGYEVTLFNRGKTNPELFPELEKLKGDRNADISALKGRSFDIVVDTSGYFPRQVEASAGLLAGNVGRYLFVSSISAYGDLSKPGLDESAATAAMPVPYSEKMPDNYGALKAGCERAAEEAMPGHAIVVRPGLIVGPGDPTDRFTYWPVRVKAGGRVLAPNDPGDPVQYVDARDLASFIVGTAADERTGIYNATGPDGGTTVGALLSQCQQVSGSDAEFVWAPTPFLAEHEVAPWMNLTVWVPTDDPEFGGMGQVNIKRAVEHGLSFRPAADTIADTLSWWEALPQQRRDQPRAGLPREREAAVLAALDASRAKPAA